MGPHAYAFGLLLTTPWLGVPLLHLGPVIAEAVARREGKTVPQAARWCGTLICGVAVLAAAWLCVVANRQGRVEAVYGRDPGMVASLTRERSEVLLFLCCAHVLAQAFSTRSMARGLMRRLLLYVLGVTVLIALFPGIRLSLLLPLAGAGMWELMVMVARRLPRHRRPYSGPAA